MIKIQLKKSDPKRTRDGSNSDLLLVILSTNHITALKSQVLSCATIDLKICNNCWIIIVPYVQTYNKKFRTFKPILIADCREGFSLFLERLVLGDWNFCCKYDSTMVQLKEITNVRCSRLFYLIAIFVDVSIWCEWVPLLMVQVLF